MLHRPSQSAGTFSVDTLPKLNATTFGKLSDVAPSDFWSPFYPDQFAFSELPKAGLCNPLPAAHPFVIKSEKLPHPHPPKRQTPDWKKQRKGRFLEAIGRSPITIGTDFLAAPPFRRIVPSAHGV